MRPEEIDYSDARKQYYFDISNGEVLAGEEQRDRYIAEGDVAPDTIRDLGWLLRDSAEVCLLPRFEPLDTSEWPKDKYIKLGQWLNQVVAEPDNRSEKRLNRDVVLSNARRLGVGPGKAAVRREFGTYGKFYAEIKATDTHNIGLFNEWELDDFLAYIRRVGGEKRPTAEDLRVRGRTDPNNPKPEYMHGRFRHIGGFRKLLELAGYPVIDLWDNQDYIDWGVQFMQANNGIIPTSRMADYFSVMKRGPSGTSVRNKFGKITNFQNMVFDAWRRVEDEKEQDRQEKLSAIESDLRLGQLPVALFIPSSDETAVSAHQAAPDTMLVGPSQDQLWLEALVGLDMLGRQFGPDEAIRRYAKHKVLDIVVPSMTMDRKVAIATQNGVGGNFKSAINKNHDVPAADIEYEALVEGVFDYIWPMDSHMEALKLDDGYKQYYGKREKVKDVRDPQPVAIAS